MARFVVIGNGKMAVDVLLVLSGLAGTEVVACVGDPRHEAAQSRLRDTCEARGIQYRAVNNINDPAYLADLTTMEPDYFVSVNNFFIFREAARVLPRRGIVNFHNGPLPRYGGLNACSWALYNGEAEHGVTWHLVDDGLDTGPIIAQSRFTITSDETAIGLIGRCIREGVRLFEQLAPRLIMGTLEARPQDLTSRLYYGSKDRPWNGWLPWWEQAAEVQRIARALSFHPFPNSFYRPRLAAEGKKSVFAEALAVELTPQTCRPGTVLAVAEEEVVVAVTGAAVRLSPLFDEAGKPVTAERLTDEFGLLPGGSLLKPI